MAYTGITNLTPATGAVAIFNMKTALVTAGWTVMSSSDGTTYNSSGDQITGGGAGAGGFGNSRAWVRLRMPTQNSVTREITLQKNSANNTDWRMKYSYSAAFTGGSPAATVTPSSTDEVLILGGGTDASPTFTNIFAADAGYRFSVMCGDATEFYTFWAGGFPTGGGNPNSLIFLDRMVDGTFPVADIDPFVWGVFGPTAVWGQALFTGASWTNIPAVGWYKKGLSGEAFVSFNGMHWSEGNVASGGSPPSVNNVMTTSLPSNPHNAKDDLIPMMWGRRLASGSGGYKGFNYMIRMGGVLRVTGDTLSLTSTRDKIILRPGVLPWDGSVVLV